MAPCGNARANGIQNTAIAYRKHAIDLGYSHASGGQRKKDANDGGQEILEDFLLLDLTTIMSCPRLLLLAEKTRTIATGWGQQHKQLIFSDIKATNASPTKGIKNMAKAVGAPPANSLKFVKRDSKTNDGKAAGTLTANQTTIDGIITRAWQNIFEGNAKDSEACVDNFLYKHSDALFKTTEAEAPDITTDGVFKALNVAGKSAASMDGWHPAELTLVSFEVARWIAELFELI